MKSKLIVVCSFLLLVSFDLCSLLEYGDRKDCICFKGISKLGLNEVFVSKNKNIKYPVYDAQSIRANDIRLKLNCDLEKLKQILRWRRPFWFNKISIDREYLRNKQYNAYYAVSYFLEKHCTIGFGVYIEVPIICLIRSEFINIKPSYVKDCNYSFRQKEVQFFPFLNTNKFKTDRYCTEGLCSNHYSIKYNVLTNEDLRIEDKEDEMQYFITKWIEHKYFEYKNLDLLLERIGDFYVCLNTFKNASKNFHLIINILSVTSE